MREILHDSTRNAIARRSITLPNFLETNEYTSCTIRLTVANQQFIAWTFTEQLDINLLRGKLLKKHSPTPPNDSPLTRSEIRFTKVRPTQSIDYLEKYRMYSTVSGSIHNDSIKSIELLDCHLIILTSKGIASVVDLSSFSPKITTIEQSQHGNQPISTILMSPIERDIFYMLSQSKQTGDFSAMIHRVSCSTNSVVHSIRVGNYAKRVGNHRPTDLIRIIRLNEYSYILFSEQSFVFFLKVEERTSSPATVSQKSARIVDGVIEKSYFVDGLSLNLCISKIEDNLFMIHNPRSNRNYILELQQTSRLQSASKSNLEEANTTKSIERYISSFKSQREIYSSIKYAWSLSLVKSLESDEKSFIDYFARFVDEKLRIYLKAHELTLPQFVSATTAVLMQLKAKRMLLFVRLVTRLLQIDSAEKEKAKHAIWDAMPLFNVKVEKSEKNYRAIYKGIADELDKSQAIDFLC